MKGLSFETAGSYQASASRCTSQLHSSFRLKSPGTFENVSPADDIIFMRIKVAETDADKARGYLGQDRPECDAIVFKYASDVTNRYHMRGVRFPLRIHFFDKEGACLHSEDMEPDARRLYGCPRPYRYAVETPR